MESNWCFRPNPFPHLNTIKTSFAESTELCKLDVLSEGPVSLVQSRQWAGCSEVSIWTNAHHSQNYIALMHGCFGQYASLAALSTFSVFSPWGSSAHQFNLILLLVHHAMISLIPRNSTNQLETQSTVAFEKIPAHPG